MHQPSGRRLMLALAAAAVTVLTSAAPALADSHGVTVRLADTTVAIGSSVVLDPYLRAADEFGEVNSRMVYELSSGLTGVSLVELDEHKDCVSESATRLVCTEPLEINLFDHDVNSFLMGGLRATRSAVAGQTGTVTVTYSADGVDPVSTTAQVRVADGVDLAAGDPVEIKAAPGASFDAPLEVTNTGTATVTGVALNMDTEYAYQAGEQFSNCLYADGQPQACSFDQELPPGATYRVVLPYRLRPQTYAPSSLVGEFDWSTAEDFANATQGVTLGEPGTGGTLTLQRAGAVRALTTQHDGNPDNNREYDNVAVTGKQGADLVAIGTSISGTAGTVVDAVVGVRNSGPATLDWSRAGKSPAVTVVTVPAGTTVVGPAPGGCRLATDDSDKTDPKAVQYVCGAGYRLLAGATENWDFRLRIDTVMADATGSVEVNPPCACDRFAADLDKSNDKAAIIVNGSQAGSGTGGGTGTGGGSGTGGGNGPGGGGLPVTGPQGAAIGGAGVLLIAAGTAGFLAARRRRTRFEA
jgi:hypothetical protein